MTETNLTATPIYHSNFEEIVLQHLRVREPMCVWSPPGCGKTEHIKQIVESAGYEFIDWRLALMDAVDVRGIPYRGEDGRTHYASPASLPVEGCKPTVLMLDEIGQAHSSVVGPAGQLINERMLGDYKLPDNVVIFAASNRHFDRAAVNRMPTHTANRFLHYELVVRPLEWIDWAINAGINSHVVSYIKFRPEQIYQFDPKATAPAFPSLRTWVKLSNMLDGVADNSELIGTFARAAVGQATGGEFAGFVSALDQLPDIDDIIANPDDHDAPKEPDLRYALTSALARRVDEDNVENIWQFMLKMPDEFQVLWAKFALVNEDFDITQHPVHNEITSLHKAILTS